MPAIVHPATFEHLPPTSGSGTLGIGLPTPRISWKTSAEPGWVQEAYQVSVTTAEEQWTSERTESKESVLVPWEAAPLGSAQRAEVSVRVWGAGDQEPSDWSQPSAVETGLLEPGDWTATAITPAWDEDPEADRRPPLLRSGFTVDRPVASARLYVTAHGLYEVEINGVRVGDDALSPGWTVYGQRLRYYTYDVTQHVADGDNAIGAFLADGWYRGGLALRAATPTSTATTWRCWLNCTSRTTTARSPWWARTKAGRHRLDQSWCPAFTRAKATMPVNCQPAGVARRSMTPAGSRSPASNAIPGRWWHRKVRRFAAPRRSVRFGCGRRRQERRCWTSARTWWGASESPWSAMPDPRSRSDTRKYCRTASCTPVRCGEPTPRTTTPCPGPEKKPGSHGSRFMASAMPRSQGWMGGDIAENVTARVYHTDMERTGWFESSNPDLNRLHENVLWSMKGNFVDIPTDCPQRDERLGWTGDIQVFAPTASFLYDCSGMLSSWLKDVAAEQLPDGTVPWYVPVIPGGNYWTPIRPGAVWGDVAVLTPWALHERFNDPGILAAQYESAKAWVDLQDRLAGESRLWNGSFQLGDWLDPTAPPEDPTKAMTDKHLVATAYFAWSARHLAMSAAVLGKSDDELRYLTLSREVAAAFAREYIHPDGIMTSDAQTAYALALVFDLFPDADFQSTCGLPPG